MNVVIAGARLRDEAQDKPLVESLVDELRRAYAPNLLIVSTPTDRGPGKLVKNYCVAILDALKRERAPFDFYFLEINYRFWADDMAKSRYASLFTSRNRALEAIGDEFHLLMGQEYRGTMEDLLAGVQRLGRPHSTYQPGEKSGPKLIPQRVG